MTHRKRITTYKKAMEFQIQEVSMEKGHCMYIPYPLPFQITCLQTLAIRKIHFAFLNLLSGISDL